MEVTLEKRYPLPVSVEQAWAVLCDIRATAACMPGAAITEQVDATHFKGTVRSKVGPATMAFGGDIEVQGLDAAARELRMLGKGADKGGSSAAMQLTAHLESGAAAGDCVLVGHAVVTVNGKLAQFGSRLLVPVADMMLGQFANNFGASAAAVPVAVADPAAVAAPVGAAVVAALPSPSAGAAAEPQAAGTAPAAAARLAPGPQAASASASASASEKSMPTPTPTPTVRPVKELNLLAMAWLLLKGWLGGMFKRA